MNSHLEGFRALTYVQLVLLVAAAWLTLLFENLAVLLVSLSILGIWSRVKYAIDRKLWNNGKSETGRLWVRCGRNFFNRCYCTFNLHQGANMQFLFLSHYDPENTQFRWLS